MKPDGSNEKKLVSHREPPAPHADPLDIPQPLASWQPQQDVRIGVGCEDGWVPVTSYITINKQ